MIPAPTTATRATSCLNCTGPSSREISTLVLKNAWLTLVLVRGDGDAARRLWKADHEQFTLARGVELNAFTWLCPDSGQSAEVKAVAGERAKRGTHQRGSLVALRYLPADCSIRVPVSQF